MGRRERPAEIIGFITAGASRDESPERGEGEVYAIYVLPDCWARGIGRNLLAHAERDLVGHGYSEAILWCFAANQRARAFYEQMGWRLDGGTLTRSIGGIGSRGSPLPHQALDRSRVAASA